MQPHLSIYLGIFTISHILPNSFSILSEGFCLSRYETTYNAIVEIINPGRISYMEKIPPRDAKINFHMRTVSKPEVMDATAPLVVSLLQ